jgi:signal peptidase I
VARGFNGNHAEKVNQPGPIDDLVDAIPDNPAPSSEGSGPSRRRFPRRGTLIFVLVVAALAVLIPACVARVYEVPSGSMETTLHGCTGCTNDRVLVDRLSYRFSSPARGDIVVFAVPPSWQNAELEAPPKPTNPVSVGLSNVATAVGIQGRDETDFIKRVIATGGQTVSCCDSRNRLVVDGKALDEPYIYFAPGMGPPHQEAFGPVRVPNGMLWVMGDSRNNSADSRAPGNGPIPVSSVVGQARLIVAPLSRFGPIGR